MGYSDALVRVWQFAYLWAWTACRYEHNIIVLGFDEDTAMYLAQKAQEAFEGALVGGSWDGDWSDIDHVLSVVLSMLSDVVLEGELDVR